MNSPNDQRIPFNKQFDAIRQNLHFILVEPQSHGNIGASARALKTCGFKNLVLVNPRIDNNQPETLWMAHRSEDILKNALIVDTFDAAINDKTLVIGTTQRKRHFKFPLYTPEEISEKISNVAAQHPVAIIFGRESKGLTNAELLKCHLQSSVLTATKKPALNLAQAVMIYAHTFFRLQNLENKNYNYDLASHYELQKFYEHLQDSLQNVGFIPRDSMDDFISRFKRLIGRSLAEKRDIRLLHKLLQIFETKINQMNVNPALQKENNKKIY